MVIHVGTLPTTQPHVFESAETVTLPGPPVEENEALGVDKL